VQTKSLAWLVPYGFVLAADSHKTKLRPTLPYWAFYDAEYYVNYLKTENGEREVDLPENVAKLLVEFIGDRKSGLLFCTRNRTPLSQSNILRRHLHPALEAVGFEKAGAHSFRRYRNTYLRNFTACPESVRNFWLGWGSENMSGHYDGIRGDVAYRRDVTKACGVVFDVPASLGSFEPIESKIEVGVSEKVAVTV